MGVPLLLIGLGAGKFMPNPGGWMEGVTKIFGIIMLGVAIWLLDRVINPTVTMYLWAFLFISFGVYLKLYTHIIVKSISKVLTILGAILLVGAVSGATNPLKPLDKFTSKVSLSKQDELKFIKIQNIAQLEDAILKSSKPVILDFWANWCVSCKELDDVTQNSEDDKAIQKKFGVVGPPALIFWDENKQEVKSAKIVGYKNPKEFLEILDKNFKN